MRPILILALVLPLTIGAGYAQETYTWNQRMTVTVETPDGPVSGTTVYEVTAVIFSDGGGLSGTTAARYTHRGEAAVIDLGGDRYIFALVEPFGENIYRAAPDRFDGIDYNERARWIRAFRRMREPLVLPEEYYPRFVTFGHITDPLTADIFEADEMATIFGEEYVIASVTLEVVRAPMEVGRIEEVLPWLEAIWPNHLDGNRYRLGEAHPNFSLETTDANQLGVGSFSTEIIE